MAMSLGKSSSMAAMLLMAVVVVGTCASGAQVQYSYDIKNLCDQDVRFGSVYNLVLPSLLLSGHSLHYTDPPVRFFPPPVEIDIGSNTRIEIPASVTRVLEAQGGKLRKIEIYCEKECVKFFVTNEFPNRPTVSPQGFFCTAPPSCPRA